MSRHQAAIDALRAAVLADADELRLAAFDATPSAGPVADFVAKVRHDSARMTDRDIDSLRAAGLDEDAILEITLAAAVGAAMESLRAARDS